MVARASHSLGSVAAWRASASCRRTCTYCTRTALQPASPCQASLSALILARRAQLQVRGSEGLPVALACHSPEPAGWPAAERRPATAEACAEDTGQSGRHRSSHQTARWSITLTWSPCLLPAHGSADIHRPHISVVHQSCVPQRASSGLPGLSGSTATLQALHAPCWSLHGQGNGAVRQALRSSQGAARSIHHRLAGQAGSRPRRAAAAEPQAQASGISTPSATHFTRKACLHRPPRWSSCPSAQA